MDDRQEQAASKIGAALFRKRRTLSRILAMQFVFQADLKNAWEAEANTLEQFKELAENILANAENGEPSVDDRTFFTDADFKGAWKYADALIQGVIATHGELDKLIGEVTQNWSLQRISMMDRAILRVAAFEILKAPKGVTPPIAINEAVEIAKIYGLNNSPRFVNGILDKIRKMLQDKAQDTSADTNQAGASDGAARDDAGASGASGGSGGAARDDAGASGASGGSGGAAPRRL